MLKIVFLIVDRIFYFINQRTLLLGLLLIAHIHFSTCALVIALFHLIAIFYEVVLVFMHWFVWIDVSLCVEGA